MIKETFLTFIHNSIVDTLLKLLFVLGMIAMYGAILMT